MAERSIKWVEHSFSFFSLSRGKFGSVLASVWLPLNGNGFLVGSREWHAKIVGRSPKTGFQTKQSAFEYVETTLALEAL